MLEQEGGQEERKYAWVDKWAKMTGERARIDAKVNNTYIVYMTKNGLVKEYPNGEIVPFDEMSQDE